MAEGPQEFRYRVSPGSRGVLALDGAEISYRQGLRRVRVPLAEVRLFAVADRGEPWLGIVASELVVRAEAPGRSTLHRIPFDPYAEPCREALAVLRRRLPEADLTGRPWEEAARLLGVAAHPWYEGLMNGRSALGLLLVAAAGAGSLFLNVASPARSRTELLARALGALAVAVVGVALVVWGWRCARRRRG